MHVCWLSHCIQITLSNIHSTMTTIVHPRNTHIPLGYNWWVVILPTQRRSHVWKNDFNNKLDTINYSYACLTYDVSTLIKWLCNCHVVLFLLLLHHLWKKTVNSRIMNVAQFGQSFIDWWNWSHRWSNIEDFWSNTSKLMVSRHHVTICQTCTKC